LIDVLNINGHIFAQQVSHQGADPAGLRMRRLE
jgi:hypothetical protein